MKRLILILFKVLLLLACLVTGLGKAHAGNYQFSGTFDGCEYGKLYPLMGGGILECREYNDFYEYSPEVRSDGREVITIGDEKVEGYLHNGHVITTKVAGEFEGCDFNKRYELQNGSVFVCSSYSYSYSYSPKVKIFIIEGRPPIVYIKGKRYKGTLYK